MKSSICFPHCEKKINIVDLLSGVADAFMDMATNILKELDSGGGDDDRESVREAFARETRGPSDI